MPPLTGQTLAETYRLLRPIGRGGMSVVYEAEHLRLKNRHLAVKVLSAEAARDEAFYLRFQREAEILSELSHPNIVQVQDFARTEQGAPYLVMELLRGETLMQRLRRMDRIPVEEARIVVRQVGAALTHAHAKGVVHRDLKPQNVFLQGEAAAGAEVKLLDFGISTMKQGLQVTRGDGVILGTSAFMSPEQAMGQISAIDRRSDVFSFAALAYLCITGKRPFQGNSDEQIRRRVCRGDPPPVTSQLSYLPRGLDEVFSRAMDRHKHQRQSRIAEFVADFFVALGGMGEAGEADGLRVTLPLAELRDSGKKGLEALEALADDIIGHDEQWPPSALSEGDPTNDLDPDDEPTRPRRPTGKQVKGLKAVPTGYPALEDLKESEKATADVVDQDPEQPDPPSPQPENPQIQLPAPGDPSSNRGIYLFIGIFFLVAGLSTVAWWLLK